MNLQEVDIEDIFPLSPMQKGMLFQSIVDEKGHINFNQVSFSFRGSLDVEVVQKTLVSISRRHPILRATFLHEGLEEPVAVILKKRFIECNIIDFREDPDQVRKVDSFKLDDLNRGFDLVKDPLMRVSLLQMGENHCMLVWSHHHILMDGWCLNLIIADFHQIYANLMESIPEYQGLTEPPSYSNYIEWLSKKDLTTSIQYWKNYLKDYSGKNFIGHSKKLTPPTKSELFEVEFNTKLSGKINKTARDHQVSASIIFQAIWGVVLTKYSGSEDEVMGLVVSGRSPEVKGVNEMIGLFMNTVPVRIKYDQSTTFSDLVQRIFDGYKSSEAHHYLPLSQVQSLSKPNRDLINHIMVFQNMTSGGSKKSLSDGDVEQADPLDIEQGEVLEESGYDFNIRIKPGDEYQIDFIYNPSVFDKLFVNEVVQNFNYILNQCLDNVDVQLDQLNLIGEQLMEGNRSDEHLNVVDQFRNAKENHLSRIALKYQDISMTYEQLDNGSESLAMILRSKYNIQIGQTIAVSINRSHHSIIALLSILKAGGAYLPINPLDPESRKDMILKDSDCRVLITTSEDLFNLSYFDGVVIAIDLELQDPNILDEELSGIKHDQGAYIIYTSGSTGKPKGVLLEHGALGNMIASQKKVFGILPEYTVGQFAQLSFDASISEIFMALCSGACLYIIEDQHIKDPNRFIEVLENEKIDVLTLPTSFLNAIPAERFKRLKKLISAGEEASMERFMELLSFTEVFNAYGPTEGTVCVTTHAATKKDALNSRVPLGQPIDNVTLRCVDKNRNTLPRGAVGELSFSGECLARGYLNDKDRTQESFIKDVDGVRWYFTGDIVFQNYQGELFYVNRKDSQVKLRGYRIDIAEIEHRFKSACEVDDVIVQIAGGELKCYYINSKDLDPAECKRILHKYLPEYMIPISYSRINQIPLNKSGKKDRTATILESGANQNRSIVPAGNDLEALVLNIWKEVLQLDEISIQDNFFEIGGHSLNAIQIIFNVQNELNQTVELSYLFDNPTIKDFCARLTQKASKEHKELILTEEQDYYHASLTQTRFWVNHKLSNNKTAYNLVRVTAVNEEIDFQVLSKSLQVLISKHELLRTSYFSKNGKIFQRILPPELLQSYLEFIDLSLEQDPEKQVNKILEKSNLNEYDLQSSPLWSFKLIKLKYGKYLLINEGHHIVFDADTIQILDRELLTTYNVLKKGESPSTNNEYQYKDFSRWQNEQLANGNFDEDLNYWKNEFRDGIPQLVFPTDYPRGPVKEYKGRTIVIENKIDSSSIDQFVKKHKITLYSYLYAAVGILLNKYSNEKEFVIGTPAIDKGRIEFNSLLGNFLNMLPIKIQIQEEESLLENILVIRKKIQNAYNHRSYPFDQLVDAFNARKSLNREPFFDIMVILNNVGISDNSEEVIQEEESDQQVYPSTSKYDLTLNFVYVQNSLSLVLEYDLSLFHENTINVLGNELVTILNTAYMSASTLIKDYHPLEEMENNSAGPKDSDSFEFNF